MFEFSLGIFRNVVKNSKRLENWKDKNITLTKLIQKLFEGLKEREHEDDEGTPPPLQVPDEVFFLLLDFFAYPDSIRELRKADYGQSNELFLRLF